MAAKNSDIEKCFWKAANMTCDAGTYLVWRDNGDLKDESGFCKATVIVEIQSSNFVLTPGRYVGVPDI